MNSLEKIIKKYTSIDFDNDNFLIGGGLANHKYASNRHEHALDDKGKLTLGKAVQMFKKATGNDDIDEIKAVIKCAVPNMEWHHAGRLPKAFGGGMKKTYFINAKEIIDIATNFNKYLKTIQK